MVVVNISPLPSLFPILLVPFHSSAEIQAMAVWWTHLPSPPCPPFSSNDDFFVRWKCEEHQSRSLLVDDLGCDEEIFFKMSSSIPALLLPFSSIYCFRFSDKVVYLNCELINVPIHFMTISNATFLLDYSRFFTTTEKLIFGYSFSALRCCTWGMSMIDIFFSLRSLF
jgi:hypothetical protein